MTIYRGPGGTGSAASDADTTLYQDFLNQTLAARDAALQAETNAELAETNAETAETNAEIAATAAASSASAASTSAANAASSASAAAISESNASSSASTASTKASEAASSATAAAGSASTASTQASNAAGSATAAANSASAAATSATNASNSASAASASATNAASSATAAQAAQTATEAVYDSFDDRYLGSKTSAPTTDNDGNTLLVGAMYFNSTLSQLYVWSGSVWIAASTTNSGDVLGPSSSTDNALVRFDGITGKLVQNSSATLSDAGNLAVTSATINGAALTSTSIGNWDTAYGWGNHASAGYLLSSTAASTYQPLDGDLTSIAGLAGTSGFLKKTAANTWSLDTSTYLTGNQSISLSGDATGSGTTSIAVTLANSGVTAGTYSSVTVDAKGRVTGGTNPGYITGNQSITISGDASGSGTTSIPLTLSNSGVTAGTYTNATVTVDAKGRVTSASSGSGGGVTSFNTRTGAVTLSSGDVTGALGYTPYNSSNPNGYTSNTGTVTSVSGTGSVSGITLSGTVTGSGSLTLGGSLSVSALNTASGSAPSYSARAWVNFNGTGTVAIRASGNVSSITDNGTGDYTVNFTTAMPDANYSGVATCRRSTAYKLYNNATLLPTSASAAQVCTGIEDTYSGELLSDSEWVSVAFFR